jgi:hypothetical protein
MTYSWTSVTLERYWVPVGTDPNIERWPFFNRLYRAGGTIGPPDEMYSYPTQQEANISETVSSVIQDFREAVGASFFDESKEDPTLVPASCVVHIDAIVLYTVIHRFMFMDWTDRFAYRYIDGDYKAAWKRATIYRREQARYLKRWLVGDLFPETVPPEVSDGVPFYTMASPVIERNL